jgi:membrane peptidoglycan carboxypeptidase
MIYDFIKNSLKNSFFIWFYFILPLLFAVIIFFLDKNIINLTNQKKTSPVMIYDKNHTLIKEFSSLIEFHKMPTHLWQAFIAIEDTEFFSHYGFSMRSIIRSFLKNLETKKFSQGGSTITQQFIKLYTGNAHKTISRKIKELCLAILLEFCYTKEEIFQAYGNILYFGKNIVGIADCARILFNKKYTEVTLEEAATMAAIVKRPEYYNPIINKNNTKKRRDLVLKRMLEENYIKKSDYENAIKKDIIISDVSQYNCNKAIFQAIEGKLSSLQLPLNHEYIVFTSIDSTIQAIITNLFNQKINLLKKYNDKIEGTIIVSNYKTGKIIAVVNGKNLMQTKNRAFSWKKQIGSIIKPFIIYFALRHGDTERSIYSDTPLEEQFKWNPNNCTKKFRGDITIQQALISSNNIVPIRILHKYGINEFNNIMQPFFQEKLNPYLSIALGCIEATAIEVANLFNTLLNNGIKKMPSCIEKIIKQSGGIIYENDNEFSIQYFEPEKINIVKNILEKIGDQLKWQHNMTFNTPIYAKTGTNNNVVNCWLMCANETYSVIICLGSDENIPLDQYKLLNSNTAVPLGLHILKALEELSNQRTQ